MTPLPRKGPNSERQTAPPKKGATRAQLGGGAVTLATFPWGCGRTVTHMQAVYACTQTCACSLSFFLDACVRMLDMRAPHLLYDK